MKDDVCTFNRGSYVEDVNVGRYPGKSTIALFLPISVPHPSRPLVIKYDCSLECVSHVMTKMEYYRQ